MYYTCNWSPKTREVIEKIVGEIMSKILSNHKLNRSKRLNNIQKRINKENT